MLLHFLYRSFPESSKMCIRDRSKEIMYQFQRYLKIYASVEDNIDSNLSKINFSGGYFKDMNLKGIDFSNCTLDNCRFINCNLAGAKLRKASMRRVNIDTVNFSGADLSYTCLLYTSWGVGYYFQG